MGQREGIPAAKTKRRHITVRFNMEDYLAIRDHAIGRGFEVGPLVEEWMRPIIDAIKKTPSIGSTSNRPKYVPVGSAFGD